MKSTASFKNKKPPSLSILQETDENAVDTFELFCNNIPQHLPTVEESFLKDSYNTLTKMEQSSEEKINQSNQFSYSNNENAGDVFVKFIQFEEFHIKSQITQSGSMQDNSRQQHMRTKRSSINSSTRENYLQEPPGPVNRNNEGRFRFPTDIIQGKVKKHLRIDIPEIEASLSSYDQTLVIQSQRIPIPQKSDVLKKIPDEIKLLDHKKDQQEIQELKSENIRINQQLHNMKQLHTQEIDKYEQEKQKIKQENNSLKKAIGQLNDELQYSKDIPKSVSPEVNEKIEYLIMKLHQKSQQNAQLHFQVLSLNNQIEEMHDKMYLQDLKEVSSEPFEFGKINDIPKTSKHKSGNSIQSPSTNDQKSNVLSQMLVKELQTKQKFKSSQRTGAKYQSLTSSQVKLSNPEATNRQFSRDNNTTHLITSKTVKSPPDKIQSPQFQQMFKQKLNYRSNFFYQHPQSRRSMDFIKTEESNKQKNNLQLSIDQSSNVKLHSFCQQNKKFSLSAALSPSRNKQSSTKSKKHVALVLSHDLELSKTFQSAVKKQLPQNIY